MERAAKRKTAAGEDKVEKRDKKEKPKPKKAIKIKKITSTKELIIFTVVQLKKKITGIQLKYFCGLCQSLSYFHIISIFTTLQLHKLYSPPQPILIFLLASSYTHLLLVSS